MAPTPSADARELTRLARAAVEHAVRRGQPLPVDAEGYPAALREPRGVFVTLETDGELRGCTGSLEASRPLVEAVAHVAYRTALADPRFPPLSESELAGLDIHLSILSSLEPLSAGSEAELLAELRPGVDGLVLRDGSASSTFLPQVWRSLPSPARFVAELKRKAGLPPDHWSPSLAFERYSVEEIA